jgi:ABC-type multidrug transport system fused ATPase/permease subunit
LIQEALVRLAQDRTTLIIAHRMGTLKDVSRRLYFEQGFLAGDGTHAHLIESVPGYAGLVQSESTLSSC